MAKTAFQLGAAGIEADDRLICDRARGILSYDRGGNGEIAAVNILKLKAGTALLWSDIVLY